jgi:hypothetical protein
MMTTFQKNNSINYTLSFEDWVEFTLDTHQRVPQMRRMRTFSHYAIGAVYAIFGLMVMLQYDEMSYGISFLFLSLAWFMLFPKYHKRRTIKYLQKLLKDGGGDMLAEHTLDFDESGIRVQREGRASSMEWTSFQDLIVTEHRVYLKLEPSQGLIVPRNIVGSEQFVEACQTYITKS